MDWWRWLCFGTVAQDAVDGDEATQFHSATGGDAYTNTFTIDMQKSYQIEKLEYVPRPDFGNGTIRKFEVDYSLDGETWKSGAKVGVDTPRWSYSTDETMKTLTFDRPLRARYLRISVKDSVGGFFTAHELRPYRRRRITITNCW
ncbi:discoidin domain-containing protein [Erysipelothrix sp. D19-032]